ncbi:hypothetical protein AVDCRST_MAG92-244 [uncultured Coleofasciculus sp.]|uniref:Uncharacterized protein n=1 Tax=uncultured Coleofasciculus sp. TaxID=1267456 RepID=A0A6J4H6W7_9CYAN|nr:hypothetical protein AVDCRST_MAG92-244 [uncultured Coleofasciculus sp.]
MFIKKYLGELQADQVSTATGVVLFGLYFWFLTRLWSIKSARQAIFIGAIWLGLTVAFEFIFGHYFMKNSWTNLFHDYNIFAGRVWMVVLSWIALAPFVFYCLES